MCRKRRIAFIMHVFNKARWIRKGKNKRQNSCWGLAVDGQNTAAEFGINLEASVNGMQILKCILHSCCQKWQLFQGTAYPFLCCDGIKFRFYWRQKAKVVVEMLLNWISLSYVTYEKFICKKRNTNFVFSKKVVIEKKNFFTKVILKKTFTLSFLLQINVASAWSILIGVSNEKQSFLKMY